jgi:hypothetical protein
MGKGSGNGPPELAGKRFTFWAHRMVSYIQAQHHDAWRTTMYPLPSVPTESEAKWNARARNHIFEALDEELFDRIFALETAHEVWMQLKEIHMGNKKIHEEKYELLKVELNEFKMNDDEGVEQMYSRMSVLIQSIMLSMLLTFTSRKSSGKSFKCSPSLDTTSSRHFSLRRTSLPSPSPRL